MLRYVQNRLLYRERETEREGGLIWATIRTALGNELTPECVKIRMSVFMYICIECGQCNLQSSTRSALHNSILALSIHTSDSESHSESVFDSDFELESRVETCFAFDLCTTFLTWLATKLH